MHFTYPYIMKSEVKMPEVTESSLSRTLSELAEEEKKPGPSVKPDAKPVPRSPTRVSRSSPYVVAKPSHRTADVGPESPGPIKQQAETNLESESVNKKITAGPKEESKVIEERLTLDKVEKFFKFTSSVTGTVFPIVGFIMTVLLWVNQRKEKKLAKTA